MSYFYSLLTTMLSRSSKRPATLTVRILMGLILVVAVGLGTKVNQINTQCEAVRVVTRAGGKVTYSPVGLVRWPLVGRWLEDRPFFASIHAILHKALGPDYFREVSSVHFAKATIGDAELQHLVKFTRLARLQFDECKLANGWSERLKTMKQLNGLSLDSVNLNEHDLMFISMMSNLRELSIREKRNAPLNGDTNTRYGFTDAGMRHIASLKKLNTLRLSHANITNDTLLFICALSQIEELDVDFAVITDTGLQHLLLLPKLQRLSVVGIIVCGDGKGLSSLSRMKNLRKLRIMIKSNTGDSRFERRNAMRQSHMRLCCETIGEMKQLAELNLQCNIELDDQCLMKFGQLLNIETLNVSMTNITNGGLKYLRAMGKLTSLDVRYTNVTAEGAADLRRQIGGVAVSVGASAR